MNASYQNRPWPFISHHIQNYTFSPHLHNQLEIVYVVSGSCSISIDQISYTAAAGNLILIFPYQIHNFYNANNCELIVQVFDPDFAPEFLPHLGKSIPEYPLLETIPSNCLDAILKAEHYYITQANQRIIHAYVGLYMSFLYERFQFIPVCVSDYHSVLHSLLLYVDAHYTEDLSLDRLAQELHVTKYYLSRIFSKKLHTSFTDYVNHLRIEYSVHLLQNTNLPVCDIAFECGFSCERTFYRAFKKEMNMTPLRFRKEKILFC